MVPNREVSAWTPLSRALFNASRCVFNLGPPTSKLLQFPRFPTVLEWPTSLHCTQTHSHLAEPQLCNPALFIDPILFTDSAIFCQTAINRKPSLCTGSTCPGLCGNSPQIYPFLTYRLVWPPYWNMELDLEWRQVDDGIPEWKTGASLQDASPLAFVVFYKQKRSSTSLSGHLSIQLPLQGPVQPFLSKETGCWKVLPDISFQRPQWQWRDFCCEHIPAFQRHYYPKVSPFLEGFFFFNLSHINE